jgi:hypothetical protein
MHLRPPARLLAVGGALALATVLSSCGFDYATDRVYTPAAGANEHGQDVDVLGAVVVSGQDGSGTFIASFASNDEADIESETVESLTGTGDTPDLTFDEFEPIEIPPGQLVNIADEGIGVFGDFGPGGYVNLDVPVVAPCDEFEGLDTSVPDSDDTYTCDIEPRVHDEDD